MSKGSPFVGKVSTPKSCWSGAVTVNSREEEARKMAGSVPDYLSNCGKSRSKNDLFGSCGSLSKSTWMASPSAALSKKVGRGPNSVLAELRHSSDSPSRIVTPNKLQNRLAKNSDFANDFKPSTPEIYSTARFIDTPRRNVAIAGDQRQLGVDKSNLVVAVRVRPLNSRENSDQDQKQVVSVKENQVNIITSYGQTHTFSYDHCFSSCYPEHQQLNDQETVYQSLARPLLDKAFEGYNTCLFAYGQTGSGKSYSVMGPIGVEHDLDESAGIVPRFCHELFSKVESLKATKRDAAIQVHISFFEIYKEKIHDLLCQMKPTLGSLRVREHPQTGPYVVDLSQHAVNSFDQVQRWLLMGNRQRATASTSVNERSSRSHAIFTITLIQRIEKEVDGQSHEVTMTSRINFIDLAGSERIASVNSVGDRREEGLTINQSLLTLGRVITALAEQTFVPYRESVLTWLLKDSLGGDSKTVMLATVSPCAAHVEETLATLRYACQVSDHLESHPHQVQKVIQRGTRSSTNQQQARTIINTARICEDPNARLIRHLREQIRILEEQVMLQDKSENQCAPSESIISGSHPSSSTARQVDELTSEIEKLKGRLADLTEQQQNVDQTWHERIAEAEMKRSSAERVLASYGLVEAKDPLQPCLVNVNQDPSLSGTLFFPIKSGKNSVGPATCSSNPPEIQLNGVMIEEDHCCIENSGGILTLTARGETYVNGQLVDSTGLVALHHGDRVILAGTHFFHLHYPTDSRRTVLETKIPDFQTACDELRRSQDERLQVAVREAQEKTRSQMLTEIEELRDKASLEISMQKHSYEDEIASLNRVLKQQQKADLYSPPHTATFATSNVVSAEEVEAMLRDTQQRLTLPSKDPDESTYVIHSMIKEGNAICKRFQSPYSFSRKDTLSDRMETAILVHDRDRQLILHWNIETMKEKLQILREAIEEESPSFPSHMLFDRRDVWRPEDESPLTLVEATIRDKLAHLTQNQSESHNSFLDESRFSIDLSSRRSSLLCRSPPVTNSCSITADACKELIMTSLSHDCLTRTFWSACFSLRNSLAHPEHTSRFAVFVTSHTFTIVSMLPGVISHISSGKELPSELKSSWLETARDQGQKLQNAIEFVLQGIKLDSQGLFAEWVAHAQSALSAILVLLCEVTVVFEANIEGLEELPLSLAVTGYLSAQKKVHQAVTNIADDVRMKITQLPDENSIDSTTDSAGSNYSINNGWLVKACHDSITQVLILLERLSDCIRVPICPVDLNCLNMSHLKFHQRIDVLLRIGSTIENVLAYLEHADLNQVKVSAAALEVQATTYADQMDAIGDVFLGDLSFAVGMVHKIVAERRRMLVLRRGRDISYSPLPPRLLASSPSRKRASSVEDDVGREINIPGSYEQSSNCQDEDGDEFVENMFISSLVIQRALRFEAPTKSSLKSASVLPRYNGKNVRFDLSDSTAHQNFLDQ